ncbi:unnamed protein product, partial [Heterotrigona itama]
NSYDRGEILGIASVASGTSVNSLKNRGQGILQKMEQMPRFSWIGFCVTPEWRNYHSFQPFPQGHL